MKGLQSLYFIWEAFGTLLRTLSLSGRVGNVLSWFLYIIISLLPVLVLGWWKRRRKYRMHGREMHQSRPFEQQDAGRDWDGRGFALPESYLWGIVAVPFGLLASADLDWEIE